MSRSRQPVNVAASVRARLLALSRLRNVEFQLVLSEFAIERLLYRLGTSDHAERFVLKGAMLFRLWCDDRHRATWDLDLLSRDVLPTTASSLLLLSTLGSGSSPSTENSLQLFPP